MTRRRYHRRVARPDIVFCRVCGTGMERRVPATEDRERAVCPGCGYIDYVNPVNIVGTVCSWGDDAATVLLCRRNIEPRKGFWTLPAGFMELQETAEQGALRETCEEAGARDVRLHGLFAVWDVVHAGQVHLYYRASLANLDLSPGPETIENGLFTRDQIPWDDIAFETVRRTLLAYFEDLDAGTFSVHTGAVQPRERRTD